MTGRGKLQQDSMVPVSIKLCFLEFQGEDKFWISLNAATWSGVIGLRYPFIIHHVPITIDCKIVQKKEFPSLLSLLSFVLISNIRTLFTHIK